MPLRIKDILELHWLESPLTNLNIVSCLNEKLISIFRIKQIGRAVEIFNHCRRHSKEGRLLGVLRGKQQE